MLFISFLLNDNCTLILIHNPGFYNLSFPNLVSKILQCDTYCSYTPLQFHVLYTISRRGVTYNLSKGLLVKYWWCLASTSWTTSTSSPSTSHLHMSNGKLSFNAASLRCVNTASRHYSHTEKYFIHNVNALIGNARQ